MNKLWLAFLNHIIQKINLRLYLGYQNEVQYLYATPKPDQLGKELKHDINLKKKRE